MGTVQHHTVVVTGDDMDELGEAHAKAGELYRLHAPNTKLQHISPIVGGVMNGYASFFIAPDGGNRGKDWATRCDTARAEFIEWLRERTQTYGDGHMHLDWFEIRFGGDYRERTTVLNHVGDDL